MAPLLTNELGVYRKTEIMPSEQGDHYPKQDMTTEETVVCPLEW